MRKNGIADLPSQDDGFTAMSNLSRGQLILEGLWFWGSEESKDCELCHGRG